MAGRASTTSRSPDTGAGRRTYDDRGADEHPVPDRPPAAALTVARRSGTAPLEVGPARSPPPPPPDDPNLVVNGGFETDLAGWNTSGSAAGVTLRRETAGHGSSWAAAPTNTAASAGTCSLNDAPNVVSTTTAAPYTATLWVRAETPGQTLRLRLCEYSAGALAGSQTMTVGLTTSWQHATVTYVPPAAGSSTLDLNAYVSGAPPGMCFVADDVAIRSG
jgi:hypothetical protein